MADVAAFGIDLGTTNSAIASCEADDVRVYKNRDRMDVTPSAVRIERNGRITVGRRAYEAGILDPDNTKTEFKRLMGQAERLRFPASGRVMSPEELSAEVLKSLLDDVRRLAVVSVTSAVITVPASFSQLQCAATARAAGLAGLADAAFLQEPIAASIAYGTDGDARDARWLVYDLGGGTFDVAVVSARGGTVSVIEHGGAPRLGGKDLDGLIVEKLIWPQLEAVHALPREESNTARWQRLRRQLRLKAEDAKIELSSINQVTISTADLEEDEGGRPFNCDITLSREQIDQLAEPLIWRTITVCRETLTRAGIEPSAIRQVLLVGGPTQMPLVRRLIANELGIPVDISMDPMTVVARGAAIFAASRAQPKRLVTAAKPAARKIHLEHEPVSPELTAFVAVKVEGEDSHRSQTPLEICIEAEEGYWDSGWAQLERGYFEGAVPLLRGKTCCFRVRVRTATGQEVATEPDTFTIRHGVVANDPPLPHALGIESEHADGRRSVDVIFERSTPLPAERRVRYRTTRALYPGRQGDHISVKLWEGEGAGISSDPEANTYAGALVIRDQDIRRPLPVGSEVELTITIDASRRIDVTAYVPLLDQVFSERVYVADPVSVAQMVQGLWADMEAQYERLSKLQDRVERAGDSRGESEVRRLWEDSAALEEAVRRVTNQGDNADPDDRAKVLTAAAELRRRIAELKGHLDTTPALFWEAMDDLASERESASQVVDRFGTAVEKKQFELLVRDGERHVMREDVRGVRHTVEGMRQLKWNVLFRQDWFWQECFNAVSRPGATFVNQTEAARLITDGRAAISRGDTQVLRTVVSSLWALQSKSEALEGRERAFRAGIERA